MTSSGEDPREMSAERARANTRSVEPGSRCTYPNERRERNQIYTLVNISNSMNEEKERSPEWVNGTGWEDAVQGWSKTPSFAYLQVQKRARKTKASEPANGCLYCADLMQGIDRGTEQNARTVEQLKSQFRLSTTYAAAESIPEKKQTRLCPGTTAAAVASATEEGPCGKICGGQTCQGEKRKMTLREAQASLCERRFFVMKESPLLQAEKKTVPVKEYNIFPPGKPKSLDTLKAKRQKNHEPPPTCSPTASEAATATKPSLVFPPVKDAAPKASLDPSSRRKQPPLSQASEKTLSDPTPYVRVSKTKEPNGERGIRAMYEALKEQIKTHEIASFAPKLAKAPRNLDPCYWHDALFPDKKLGPTSISTALRRHSHPNSVNVLHSKAAPVNKAHGSQDPCARSRSHTGAKRQPESKVPLLSGLFPSLTVSRLTVTALPPRLT